MNLTNGACYRNADGVAVRCQLEGDGQFHLYNALGEKVGRVPEKTEVTQARKNSDGEVEEQSVLVDTDVNGWRQIGEVEFKSSADAAKKGKGKNKKKGKYKSEEVSDVKPEQLPESDTA